VVGEDQPIVREGIVHILQDGGFEVVATAQDARELVRKVKAYRPDVVVTDIQMPPDRTDDGLRAALEIRAAQPSVGVLILSQFLEDRYAFDLVADGAQALATCSRKKLATSRRLPMRYAGSRPVGLH
jgi:DNA-binding NarL/FixJ family response regulator